MLNKEGARVHLISCRTDPGETVGVVAGDRWLPVADLLLDGPATMLELLAAGPSAMSALGRTGTAERILADGHATADLDRLAPVPRPGKVVAVGRNFRAHAEEEGVAPPEAPLLFAKWPSAVVGSGAEIRWDPALTSQVDYEAELAVVIGRRGRRISEADALDIVAGYTCLNDVSARDLQFGDGQWVRGKSLDTFCPMGPALVTADEIPDPQVLSICCIVGEEVVQRANTSQMYFSVAEIVSYCSRAFTLDPGDVIATGTPAGVGVFREPPRFLTEGDTVTVEIESIGRLENRCRFDRAGDVQ